MTDHLIEFTAAIIASYVEANKIAADDLPQLIRSVYGALSGADAPQAAEPAARVRKLSAALVRKSITPAGLVSFEDGRTYKALRRHLSSRGLTPDAYREKWGLPADYPMVSPEYSAVRSAYAKSIGLGRKPSTTPKGKSRGSGSAAAKT